MKLTDSMQTKKLKCNYRPWRATIRATGVSASDSSWACWLNTKTRRTKSSGSLVSLEKSGEIQNCVVADNKIQDRQGIWQASFLGGSAIRLPMLFTNRRWTKFIRKKQNFESHEVTDAIDTCTVRGGGKPPKRDVHWTCDSHAKRTM